MESARVLVIEDDDGIRDSLQRYLALGQHIVKREAATLLAALAAIDDMHQGSLDCNVIILDGNLRPGLTDGSDAKDVLERVKNTGITAKIIGLSGNSMKNYGLKVDADITKGASLFPVLEAIDNF